MGLPALCLVLGDAEACESSEQTSDSSSNSQTGESSHDGASGDEWADAWDGECTKPGEKAQGPANDSAGCRTSCRGFRGFGCFLMSECTSAVGVSHQYGYVVVSNTPW